MDIAPTDKHRALEQFKTVEEFAQGIDRCAKTGERRIAAAVLKFLRAVPDPQITQSLKAQQRRSAKKHPWIHGERW